MCAAQGSPMDSGASREPEEARCRSVAGTVAEELGTAHRISSVTSPGPGTSRVTPSLSVSWRVFCL